MSVPDEPDQRLGDQEYRIRPEAEKDQEDKGKGDDEGDAKE
jgi:hypothetical protein